MSSDLPDSAACLKQQRMEAVNRLAAGVAHEFNNVLQIVRGYVAFARQSLPEESQTRADLDSALEATDRAAGLATRLLQFARAEDDEGGQSDINDAVEALRLLLRPVIGENIQLEVDLDDDLPLATAGDASLRQALLNLCVNARDAMPEGGALRLETARVPHAEGLATDLGPLEAGAYARVSVFDTGEGMDEVTRDRLFEPFFTTKDPDKGTGLGLAMVASFVKNAGGGIVVTSRPGEGARFDLYLPTATHSEAEAVLGLESLGLPSEPACNASGE